MATILDELLEVDGEQHWSKWMRQSRARLLNSDYSGIELLFSAYGSMESFNNFVIYQSNENGQFHLKEGYIEKNNRLDELRGIAWELAEQIRREHISSK